MWVPILKTDPYVQTATLPLTAWLQQVLKPFYALVSFSIK